MEMAGVTPLGDADPCPYEKYAGTPMEDIPASYLLWLDQQDSIKDYPEVKGYIDWARTCLVAEVKHGAKFW